MDKLEYEEKILQVWFGWVNDIRNKYKNRKNIYGENNYKQKTKVLPR